jgi:hypothetical protein
VQRNGLPHHILLRLKNNATVWLQLHLAAPAPGLTVVAALTPHQPLAVQLGHSANAVLALAGFDYASARPAVHRQLRLVAQPLSVWGGATFMIGALREYAGGGNGE